MRIQPQDLVRIYEDPRTQQQLEGTARVVKVYDTDRYSRDFGLIDLAVKFDGEDEITVRRSVLVGKDGSMITTWVD